MFECREQLKLMISTSLKSVLNKMAASFKPGEIYSFVVSPASAYTSLGISFSTRSYQRLNSSRTSDLDADLLGMLKDHPDLLEQVGGNRIHKHYFELNACEWDYQSSFPEQFEEVNNLLYDNYDDFYDTLEPEEIEIFFESLLVEILVELKRDNCFSRPVFEKDVLTGIQFPDGDWEAVERVSEAVNSPYWHQKIKDYRAGL